MFVIKNHTEVGKTFFLMFEMCLLVLQYNDDYSDNLMMQDIQADNIEALALLQ